jgi:predicted phosphohydrolase
MNSKLLYRTGQLLQYVSDLHLEKGFVRTIVPRKPNLVLCGDIGYPKQQIYKDFMLNTASCFDKVFIISGNHEYDNEIVIDVENEIENICSMRNNLFFLQKKTHVLCPVNNISIAGCTMWSQFPHKKRKFHVNHVNWLEQTVKQNIKTNFVITTHHCPVYECLSKNSNDRIREYFASDQSKILKENNVLKWIHGHSHINRDINIHGKNVVSNQYGSYEKPLYVYKN